MDATSSPGSSVSRLACLLVRFVDSVDGNTEETALTIANTDIKIFKGGATTLADKNSGGATHVANGMYSAVLDATDTNTVGLLEVHVHVAGALSVKGAFYVLEEAVYDALFAASAPGYVANAPVNVAQFGGSNGTFAAGRPEVNTTHAAGTAWGSGAITAASIAANAITAATFASNALGAVWDEIATSHVTVATMGQVVAPIRVSVAQAGAAGTITLDASANASDDFYNNTLIHITGGTGAGQSRFISDYVGATKVATVNANWVTNPDNTSAFVIRAFASIPGATAPTAVENAQAVWDRARASHTTAGTFGQGVASVQGNVTGSVASVAGAVGSVTGAVGSIAAGGITSTSFAAGAINAAAIADGAIDAATFAAGAITSTVLAASAINAIADQNWDELLSGHAGAGSAGAALTAAGTAGDPWITPLPGAYAAGTAGYILGSVPAEFANFPTTGEFIDELMAEPMAGHTTADTFGQYVNFNNDCLESDRYILVTTTPWRERLIKRGTGTVSTGVIVLEKQLYSTAGANITSTTTVIGQAKD